MISRFMSYRIVILNGAKRGERLDIGRSALTIGRGPLCDIQLPDHDISETHAKISPLADGLQISVLGETDRLKVNKAEIKTSSLENGDMIEIGTTRLFVQSQRIPGPWENLHWLRKWRKWITIGLPILLLASVPLVFNRCRQKAEPQPAPSPVARHSLSSSMTDTNNTDWMVTNAPQIQIHSSIILTSIPPEIDDAKKVFMQSRTNNLQQEIDAAQREIEFAATFLSEASAHPPETQAPPDTALTGTPTNQTDRP